jgi:hypothetical protein
LANDFAKLFSLLAERTSPDCENGCDLRIEKAFAKHALPDHPRSSK